MTERYLLFYGYWFYPRGGWSDFKGHFPDVDNAMYALQKACEKRDCPSWAEIVDLETREIIRYISIEKYADGTITFKDIDK